MGVDDDSSRSRASVRWWLAAFGSALLAAPVMVWSLVGTPAPWAVVAAALLLLGGMACVVVATVLASRSEGVSGLRLAGRVLGAPLRFLRDFTF